MLPETPIYMKVWEMDIFPKKTTETTSEWVQREKRVTSGTRFMKSLSRCPLQGVAMHDTWEVSWPEEDNQIECVQNQDVLCAANENFHSAQEGCCWEERGSDEFHTLLINQ